MDWRAIERRNGELQRNKRNALAKMAAVPELWTERGSENLAGRMHASARSPDGQKLYAGSALGGVWRGTLDGGDWTPLGDNIYGGAHWLAVVPGAAGQPDVVLRATDDGKLHVTRDDGVTWELPAGLPGVIYGVRRVLVTADGLHTIFLVLRYKLGIGERYALYRSTDAALSFTQVLYMNTFPGDAWCSRSGPSPVWATNLHKLQISTDNGTSFTDVGPLPVTSSGGELAGSEAGAPRFWVMLSVSGAPALYRSDDAGASWTPLGPPSDYWGVLTASITNPDLVAYGAVEVWRSTNGGGSFSKVNGWGDYYANPAGKLHADIMGMDVAPDGAGETWYIATDGGLYRSTTGLMSVENLSLSGLRVSQYYTTHSSAANPLHVVAGSQDQGYQRADTPPGAGGLLAFEQLISGDYGHATSGDGTHAYVYSTYPGFVLIQKGEDNPLTYTSDFPAGESYGWLPTVTADPTDTTRFFFCASHLWRYTKHAIFNTWSKAQWSSQNFAVDAGEYLSALAFSPLDSNRAWAATSEGRLYASSDGGLSWTAAAGSGPGPHYFYGTALIGSRLDANTAYVGGSGYQGSPVWRTTDGGATWHSWGSGLPNTLVYCLAEAADGSGLVVAGGESTAWRRDPGAASWVDITANQAPATLYWSVEAVPFSSTMRFGTYGRGIWDYSLVEPCAYTAFGVGLGGSNTATLDSSSPTLLGTSHVLALTGVPPGASAVLLYSLSPASLPLKGGTLLVEPTTMLQIPFTTDGSGGASIPLLMPSDPFYEGLPLNFQVVVPPPLPGGAWALSNGLKGVLCS